MILRGGHNIGGAPVGVICLDTPFPKPPGHIKHPRGLRFPALYRTLRGAGVAELLEAPDDELRRRCVAAARELEREGAAAITGSCGFMALFQRELAAAVAVPVFASALMLAPLARAMLAPGRTVGVLTASAARLTAAHFAAAGADIGQVAVAGLEAQPEFREVILEGRRADLDLARLRDEVTTVAAGLARAHPRLGAVILECTDLSHFAPDIQQAAGGAPVFDLVGLAAMTANAVARPPPPPFPVP